MAISDRYCCNRRFCPATQHELLADSYKVAGSLENIPALLYPLLRLQLFVHHQPKRIYITVPTRFENKQHCDYSYFKFSDSGHNSTKSIIRHTIDTQWRGL